MQEPSAQQRTCGGKLSLPESVLSLIFFSASFTPGCRIGCRDSATRRVACRRAVRHVGLAGSGVTGAAPVGIAMNSVPAASQPTLESYAKWESSHFSRVAGHRTAGRAERPQQACPRRMRLDLPQSSTSRAHISRRPSACSKSGFIDVVNWVDVESKNRCHFSAQDDVVIGPCATRRQSGNL